MHGTTPNHPAAVYERDAISNLTAIADQGQLPVEVAAAAANALATLAVAQRLAVLSDDLVALRSLLAERLPR